MSAWRHSGVVLGSAGSPHTVSVFMKLDLTEPACRLSHSDGARQTLDRAGSARGCGSLALIGSWSFLLFEREKLQQVSAANENKGIRMNTHTHTHCQHSALSLEVTQPHLPHTDLCSASLCGDTVFVQAAVDVVTFAV